MKKFAQSEFQDILLLLLIIFGIILRFSGMQWNEGANLHPDEYGLTNTLTQLSFPRTTHEYFNTRISPISPYNKYDSFGVFLQDGADNRMRWGQWPIILLRGMAELTQNTGYDDLRIMGRYFSAVIDTLTLLLVFLIGRRLYGMRVGLLGAGLSSLAVLQIQQSHFMTADNFAAFFSTAAMYAAVRIAQTPPLVRAYTADNNSYSPYHVNHPVITAYILFGITLGMALASKINLLPLTGMALIAAFVSIADLKLKVIPDIKKIFITVGLLVGLSYMIAAVTFRITQPMSFRAISGDTSLFTIHLNADWVDSMKVSMAESSGEGGGPPAEQWTDRAVILFPIINMVVWGLGIPLGIAAWYGWGRAAWQILRGDFIWRQHLLPVVWIGGFCLFMGTRFVKSMRYFLPIYPFLCLLAAWAILFLFTRIKSRGQSWSNLPRAAPYLLTITVILSTLIWATVFTRTVYQQTNTRIQATRWIYQNIPAPIHIRLLDNDQAYFLPVAVQDGTLVSAANPFQQYVYASQQGLLTTVTLPHIFNASGQPISLAIRVSSADNPFETIGQASILIPSSINPRGDEVIAEFNGGIIIPNQGYTITLNTDSLTGLTLYQNTIASEEWDEGLPVPLDGYNPYDGLYRGIVMPVRWTDDDNKRETMLRDLEQVDYITLSSQRALWSVCRLQNMYPMTIEYYRALFDGDLGFDEVISFQAPFQFGPLTLSDAGGTVAWGELPDLPLFNFNPFAAEEAFTVYDHAPVWIFEKNDRYSQDRAASILHAVDLTEAHYQSPVDTQVLPLE
jgi:hypothetical protein